MRWRERQHGDKRVRRVFLWWPTYFNGYWYWLERATLYESWFEARVGHLTVRSWWSLDLLEPR